MTGGSTRGYTGITCISEDQADTSGSGGTRQVGFAPRADDGAGGDFASRGDLLASAVEIVSGGPCARSGLRAAHPFWPGAFLGGARLALLLVGVGGLVRLRHVGRLEMGVPR